MSIVKDRRKNRVGKDASLAEVERLRAALEYIPETGDFLWRNSHGRQRAGVRAGSQSGGGYVVITFDNIPYMAHRLAWVMFYGEWPDKLIDHINHERSDNRIKNLRVVDNVENHRNLTLRSNNKTGYTGVVFCKFTGRYMASINFEGKHIFLGRFDSIPEAAKARKDAQVKYGFHDNHGVGPSVPRPARKSVFVKAKPFSVMNPAGQIISGVNLSKFCKDNGLRQSGMWDVVNGRMRSHKGWTAAPKLEAK